MNISEAIKQKSFSSPHEMALINVLFTSNWLRDKQKEYFYPYDLKPQHFNVLRILKGKYPDNSCPGDIKDVMLDKSPDLTRLIDKMMKMGLVERNVCHPPDGDSPVFHRGFLDQTSNALVKKEQDFHTGFKSGGSGRFGIFVQFEYFSIRHRFTGRHTNRNRK